MKGGVTASPFYLTRSAKTGALFQHNPTSIHLLSTLQCSSEILLLVAANLPSTMSGLPSTPNLITTVQQHILHQQREHFPTASGTFSWLLSGITLATKMIEAKVRRAGLLDVLGAAGDTNVQGEVQQKLDVYANRCLFHCLGVRDSVAILASEENEHATCYNLGESGKYIVVFDPLDGSSNIDVNVSVGTIFSILGRPPQHDGVDPAREVLQPGLKQLAAGYVLYGSSTMFVYTAGHGVFGFTLDPAVGAYVLSHDNMRMPAQGKYYSVNESNAESFPDGYRRYLHQLRAGGLGREYSSRYIGSLVSDFHRTLLKGGVFLYPPTKSHPTGKLRLLYEANPIAFIAEQAGGVATDGCQRILDIIPTSIHQRTPLMVGGREEMAALARCLQP
jgi:fructose-1,6-bisphosphatase I